MFCCADQSERQSWITNLQQVTSQFHDTSQPQLPVPEGKDVKDGKLFGAESPREAITPKTPATWKSSRSNPTDVFSSIAKKAAGKVAGGAFNGFAGHHWRPKSAQQGGLLADGLLSGSPLGEQKALGSK